MNYYTIKSIEHTKKDGFLAIVDMVIGENKITERFDARYLPLDSKEALDAYFKNWMDNRAADVAVAVSDEVEAIIGKKQTIEE